MLDECRYIIVKRYHNEEEANRKGEYLKPIINGMNWEIQILFLQSLVLFIKKKMMQN